MDIQEEIRGQVVVFTLSGAMISGPDVAEFHEQVQKLAAEGIVNVVVNFAEVKWFGSAMLGVMSASIAALWNLGGDLRLTGVSPQIESIIKVTKLAEIFKVWDSVDLAIESFTDAAPSQSASPEN
ncbi:MAG: STAS domain-containing protein [bacterium]|nr:STAS domain-containing protein [bacterium]